MSIKVRNRMNKEMEFAKETDHIKKNNIKLTTNTLIKNIYLIGENCSIGYFTYLEKNVHVNMFSKIGNYCSIAEEVKIGLLEHPINWLSTHPFQYKRFYENNPEDYRILYDDERSRGVIIENDVWIGCNAIIRNGVKISNGAIIAAGAVVTKDVPPYAIVAGVPAKIIKYRFNNNIINILLDLKWWLLPAYLLKNVDFTNIDIAIKQIYDIKSKNALTTYDLE